MDLNTQKVLTETLDLVNKTRMAFELQPLEKMPKGTMTIDGCPLTKALRDCRIRRIYLIYATATGFKEVRILQKVWETKTYFFEGLKLKLPKIFQRFVKLFDSGKYPELGE